jgi:hypothetical protein
MGTFVDQLRQWQPFYSTVAAASATLTGLLFVSLSLHKEGIATRAEGHLLRAAQRSFGDFLYVLMIGLVFLVPHQAPLGLAVALFALGAGRGFGLARQAARFSRKVSRRLTLAETLRELGLPLLATLGLLTVGVEVLRGDIVAIYALVIVIAALLATASWNAWLLLVWEKEPPR